MTRAEPAIKVLNAVTHVRNGRQHVGAMRDGKAVMPLPSLGLTGPPPCPASTVDNAPALSHDGCTRRGQGRTVPNVVQPSRVNWTRDRDPGFVRGIYLFRAVSHAQPVSALLTWPHAVASFSA